MNFLFQNLTDTISEMMTETMDGLSNLVIAVFMLGEKVALGNELAGVNNCLLFTQGIASMLLCCMAAKQIFSTYITETDGDPDVDPTQMLVKFSMAAAVVWASGSLSTVLCGWGKKFSEELAGSAEVEYKNILQAALGSLNGQFISIILLLVYIIGVVVFLIKAGIRGAELVLFKVLTPIFCCDIVSPSRERWNAFISSYLATVFGYAFQLLLFRFSLQLLYTGAFLYSSLALAFLWLAVVMPKWLEKFCYSSGLGRIAGQSSQSVAFLAASFLRSR